MSADSDHLLQLAEVEAMFGVGSRCVPHEHAVTVGGGGEVVPCSCGACGAWRAFCTGRYEVWTREWVDALSAYLEAAIGARADGVVLDVGCGDGTLVRALRARLPQHVRVLGADTAVPRDCGHHSGDAALVHRMDAHVAMLMFRPTIVLSTWMPLGVNWTPLFRSLRCVEQYILVGHADMAGLPEAWQGTDEFTRVPLQLGTQLCFLDEPWQDTRHSYTVAFVRARSSPAESHSAPPR